MTTHRRRACVALLGALVPSLLPAATPAGERPMLTFSGRITRYTDSGRKVYEISEAALLAMPRRTIRTGTSWTPPARFEGPLLSHLLQLVGGTGSTLRCRAVDDYEVSVPASDAERWGVILAHSMDGKRLSSRDFGPLWLVYPRDEYPRELDTPATVAKFIWQVDAIEVA
ncbi:molybdopterin-dependent oxidoreductase [Aquabacterium sp. A7-Y]|uniref:molybdopterin-dependent oxidoreductase n=1 Tax=Aquabacterium sp. A7-Y TaxID=1349605 RepID=UPI00223D28C0|nr:molybdopterin-dependent oxidoreductase [Aquabacterium sp. A7-Y]MCW7539898.1 molybdopterin-dependent oxidoreductase [Aquabacterium sp. A7-Y]